MSQEPLPKGYELVNNIVKLKVHEVEKNEFMLKKYEKEAKWLMRDDPGLANLALGSIYAIRGDLQKLMPYFERAIQLRPEDSIAMLNYAKTLGEFYQFSKSILFYERALEIIDPIEQEIMSIIAHFEYAGLFSKSVEYIQLINKVFPDKPVDLDNAVNALKTLAYFKISEQSVFEMTKFFEQFIRDKGLYPQKIRIDLYYLECLQYHYLFDAPEKTIDELQEEFDDIVWENGLSKTLKDYVTAEFFAAEEDNYNNSLDVERDPQVAIPIDSDQMKRIAKLVEGIEVKL